MAVWPCGQHAVLDAPPRAHFIVNYAHVTAKHVREPCPSGTNRVCGTRVTDPGSYPRPRPSSLPLLYQISSIFSPPLSSPCTWTRRWRASSRSSAGEDLAGWFYPPPTVGPYGAALLLCQGTGFSRPAAFFMWRRRPRAIVAARSSIRPASFHLAPIMGYGT